jgi:hypothetical protein
MPFKDHHEFLQVMMIRKMTGKKVKICQLCYRMARGNFRRAVELCSSRREKSDSPEGGW